MPIQLYEANCFNCLGYRNDTFLCVYILETQKFVYSTLCCTMYKTAYIMYTLITIICGMLSIYSFIKHYTIVILW